jgi:hypothetical protein
MMRIQIIVVAVGIAALGACTKKDAAEEARKEAAALEKEQAKVAKPAQTVKPPISNEARVPCEQLIDPAKFTEALGEAEPLTVRDVSKSEPEAAASCSLVRGGQKLTAKEQEALAKKTNHRLGVLPGDDLCNVSAFCWTVETPENFEKRCKERMAKDPGLKEDKSMGHFSCMRVVAQGADDVFVFRFYDDDTKCILQVRGGPSNVDNDNIRTCAATARDTIGPAQIAVEAPPPPR